MITEKDLAGLYARMGKQSPLQAQVEKVSKYRAKNKELDGHKFDSTLESEAYVILKTWQQCGVISGLELQPTYILQEKQKGMRAIKYVADFRFIHEDGQIGIVDVKGVYTPVFLLKAKMFRARFPDLNLQIWDKASIRQRQGRA